VKYYEWHMDFDPNVEVSRSGDRFTSMRHHVSPGSVLVLALIASAVFLVFGARNLWFFGDEWAFLIDRRRLWAADERIAYLFDPHNEHLSTIPVLINSTLFFVFGLRTYIPYLLVVVLAHLTLCYLLYRVALRCGVERWTAVATVTVFAFFGSGAENLTWAFQIGFIGATALGIGQLLVADHDGPLSRRDVFGAVLGCLGVLTAGVAVTMVAIVGLLLVLRRRWLAAALQVVPAGVLYAVWYLGYGSERITTLPREVSQIPPYVQAGLATALDAWVQLPPAGIAVGLTLLLVTAAGLLGPIETLKPAIALAVGSVLLYSINGFGRASFGIDQARASRYVYIAGALLLPLIASGLSAIRRHPRPAMSLAAALLIGWSLVSNVSAYFAFVDWRMTIVDPPRDRIMAASYYADRGLVDEQTVVEPTYSAPVTMGTLADLLDSGDLVRSRSDVSADALLQAAADFGVSVDEEANASSSSTPLQIESVRDASSTSLGSDCTRIVATGPTPAVMVGSSGTASATTAGGAITVVVSENSLEARRDVPVEPGVPIVLTLDVLDGTVGFDLAGTSELLLCGVAPP
jgi:hypothetical protein